MNRKVLLLEPNYKNKYPPMPLMKLATYFRRCKDDVRFFKGDLKDLAANLLCEELYKEIDNEIYAPYYKKIEKYIRYGKRGILEDILPLELDDSAKIIIESYRKRYKKKEYPTFDIIAVTTLFTFYWAKTVDTINEAKLFVHKEGRLLVGGVAATILPDYLERETSVKPFVGLLDRPGMIDSENSDIIDELPLDYSILDEIDYKYPAYDAYFGYMTRGCIRNCAFCAVKTLEPVYKPYISLKDKIKTTVDLFGIKRDLLLMDNNVFASNNFNEIIEEIKQCGYEKGATYIPENEYELTVRNMIKGYNDRAYRRKIIEIYDRIAAKLDGHEAGEFYNKREELGLLHEISVTKESVESMDERARAIYNLKFKCRPRQRFIDFNQGIDARLVTMDKMKKLSEIAIKPLRIAFDHYEQKDIYEKAVRIAAECGIKHLSNYLLYNFNDTPEELYYRMRLNVDLCEELDVAIYSFPMKYHPIMDPDYFRNRDFIGEKWNRKFIRAVQAVLNATKGKIGRGLSFFNKAFGQNIEEFFVILWMPEAFIIYRNEYERNNLVENWKNDFNRLSEDQIKIAKDIIGNNKFTEDVIDSVQDKMIQKVLRYYQIGK